MISVKKYTILVKNLYEKLGEKEYLRNAIRDREDNGKLVQTLKMIVS